MTTVEIILLIVGIVFMIASFFVTERLSQKEVTQLAEVSSTAVKRILEKNMQQTKVDVAMLWEDPWRMPGVVWNGNQISRFRISASIR